MTTIFRKWLEPVTGYNTRSFVNVTKDTLIFEGQTNMNLDIGACYKVISLEFSSGRGRKKSLKKLAVLQEALDTVKAELEKEA